MMRVATMVLLVSACGTAIQFTQVNPAPHVLAPRPVESVEIFTSGPPSRPHVDVGVFEATPESGYSLDDTPQILSKLRVQAATAGCDGLVASFGSRVVGDAVSLKVVNATCIVYTDGGGPAPAEQLVPVAAAAVEVEGAECEPVAGMKNTYRCNGTLVCREGRCVRPQ